MPPKPPKVWVQCRCKKCSLHPQGFHHQTKAQATRHRRENGLKSPVPGTFTSRPFRGVQQHTSSTQSSSRGRGTQASRAQQEHHPPELPALTGPGEGQPRVPVPNEDDDDKIHEPTQGASVNKPDEVDEPHNSLATRTDSDLGTENILQSAEVVNELKTGNRL